jgi:chromosome partitioning protein
MPAKILTIANQKGGSGKTCVAMTLAGAFGRRGFSVALVDGDEQGTATSWYASAPEGKPFPARVTNLAAARNNFSRPVRELVSEYEVIVIDTPGAMESPVLTQALAIADVALVPMIPAPGDLWATAPLIKLLDLVRGTNPGLKVRVVPNMVQGTSIAEDAMETLRDLGLEVATSSLGLRTAYRQAIGLGCTVLDLKDPKAIDEVDKLTTEALELLGLPKSKKKKPAAKRA